MFPLKHFYECVRRSDRACRWRSGGGALDQGTSSTVVERRAEPSTWPSSTPSAVLPDSSNGCRTVVRSAAVAASPSSKPITATSLRHAQPAVPGGQQHTDGEPVVVRHHGAGPVVGVEQRRRRPPGLVDRVVAGRHHHLAAGRADDLLEAGQPPDRLRLVVGHLPLEQVTEAAVAAVRRCAAASRPPSWSSITTRLNSVLSASTATVGRFRSRSRSAIASSIRRPITISPSSRPWIGMLASTGDDARAADSWSKTTTSISSSAAAVSMPGQPAQVGPVGGERRHHADAPGAAPGQADRLHLGHESQLVGGRQHPWPGRRADPVGLVQDVRHRRDAHPGMVGNLVDGDPIACRQRRLASVPPRMSRATLKCFTKSIPSDHRRRRDRCSAPRRRSGPGHAAGSAPVIAITTLSAVQIIGDYGTRGDADSMHHRKLASRSVMPAAGIGRIVDRVHENHNDLRIQARLSSGNAGTYGSRKIFIVAICARGPEPLEGSEAIWQYRPISMVTNWRHRQSRRGWFASKDVNDNKVVAEQSPPPFVLSPHPFPTGMWR